MIRRLAERLRNGARRQRPLLGAGTLLVLAIVGGALIVGGGITATSAGAAPNPIVLTNTSCAVGWHAPQSGPATFTIENTSDSIFGVDLVGANQLTVYGELDMVAPGTSVAMYTVLPPGAYAFACESFAGSTTYSSLEHVTGAPVTDAHPYTPPETTQVQNATIAYQASLLPYMKRLQQLTDALTQAVDSGNLSLAMSRWLPAHLAYSRLGAAYDTFGDFNDEINGRPLGLVGGVNSPDFHGFLRLEYGLWHHQSLTELIPVANALDSAVHGLVKQFPSMLMPMNDLSLRTHEILENALQFELTGETDEGSHTNLATAWANAQGTALSLRAITPLLDQHSSALVKQLQSGLAGVTAKLKSYEHPNGSWTPVQSLTTSQREHLDGSLSALLEQLSNVPDLLELPIRPESPND